MKARRREQSEAERGSRSIPAMAPKRGVKAPAAAKKKVPKVVNPLFEIIKNI